MPRLAIHDSEQLFTYFINGETEWHALQEYRQMLLFLRRVSQSLIK